MGGAVHHGAHGVDGAEAEVVVEVRGQLHAALADAERLDDGREIVVDAFGREHAAGV